MKKYKIFSISGYWKNDKEEFNNYLICSYEFDFENIPDEINDDDIFFYGLSEDDIIKAIEIKEENGLEFIITSYEK